MHGGHGRNSVPSLNGGFALELPRILPVFERTDQRTTHHWRDALRHRRLARKGRRIQLNFMARTGAKMLSDLVGAHRKRNLDHQPVARK